MTMTNEEAIQCIKHELLINVNRKDLTGQAIGEALDMAIEALKDRTHGEWIDKGTYAECLICGADSGTQYNGVQPVPRITSFCPDCGADMRGDKE